MEVMMVVVVVVWEDPTPYVSVLHIALGIQVWRTLLTYLWSWGDLL